MCYTAGKQKLCLQEKSTRHLLAQKHKAEPINTLNQTETVKLGTWGHPWWKSSPCVPANVALAIVINHNHR